MKSWAALSVAALVFSAHAKADTYHRFWTGTKLSSLSYEQFDGDLNQVFIPATVNVGAEKGMIAYEPILTEGAYGLPDEVALVSYSSLDAYNALFATDAGKTYQNLHWQYFDRSNSHSVVPEPFTNTAEVGHAYDLRPKYADWMKNQTTVLVHFRANEETDADYAQEATAHLNQALSSDPAGGILDRATLLTPKYWIEYVSASAGEGLSLGSGADLIVPVMNETGKTARIAPETGINLQF